MLASVRCSPCALQNPAAAHHAMRPESAGLPWNQIQQYIIVCVRGESTGFLQELLLYQRFNLLSWVAKLVNIAQKPAGVSSLVCVRPFEQAEALLNQLIVSGDPHGGAKVSSPSSDTGAFPSQPEALRHFT
jgi:hypothetical protein